MQTTTDYSQILYPVINFILFAGVAARLGRKPLRDFFASHRQRFRTECAEAEAQQENAKAYLNEVERRLAAFDQEVQEATAAILRTAEREAAEILESAARHAAALQQNAQHELRQVRQEHLELLRDELRANVRERCHTQLQALSPERDSRLVESKLSAMSSPS